MKEKLNKIIKAYKNYKPTKKECFLYFFIPLIVSSIAIMLWGNHDFWFLLNHGKYVLNHGFPTIEPFTMHKGLSFVMQQWLSAVIFYLFNCISARFGLYILCFIVNIFVLFFLYKLCMELSNNNYRISTALAILTDFFLLLFRVILPRPQIFTYLLLIITLYIMEKFYKNKNTKAIYFLPLISILQINFHASMYFMLYIFMLPYLANFIYLKYKDKKDNRVFKLLLIWLIMFACAFINPYGIKAITYVFTSYGNDYINLMVGEMNPTSIGTSFGLLYFIILISTLLFFRLFRKGKFELRQSLLFGGLTFLALKNYRNVALWLIGVIPYLIIYLKPYLKKEIKVSLNQKEMSKLSYTFFIGGAIAIIVLFSFIFQLGVHCFLDKGMQLLLDNYDQKEMILYTDAISGSYAEYKGLIPYIDVRSEVFLKKNNKKVDLYDEFYELSYGKLYYKDFVNKYNFTHLIVRSEETFYKQILNDKDYKIIYYGKCQNKIDCEDYGDYVVLEKIKE